MEPLLQKGLQEDRVYMDHHVVTPNIPSECLERTSPTLRTRSPSVEAPRQTCPLAI